jgi:hypothetical protein
LPPGARPSSSAVMTSVGVEASGYWEAAGNGPA